MKCFANRKALLDAFALASSVCQGAKSTKPILRHVLMRADPEAGTVLEATNLELWVRVPVAGCKVDHAGTAVLDGDRIGQALAIYPDDDVRVSAEDGKVQIVGAKSKSSLASDDPNLFPSMPTFPTEGPKWSIDPMDLMLLTDRTSYATDPITTRYALGGCKLEFECGSLGFVATDGRRLSSMVRPADGPESTLKAIVPVSAWKLAAKMYGKEASPIELAFSSSGSNPLEPHLCHLRGVAGEIASRLVEGRFPSWRDHMPKEAAGTAKVAAGAFRSAIRCASIVASDETRGLDFAFSRGSLLISGKTPDRGTSDATVDLEYDGPEMTLSLDGRNAAECLARIDDAAMLTIKLVDRKEPVIFTLEDGWFHSMQPINL